MNGKAFRDALLACGVLLALSASGCGEDATPAQQSAQTAKAEGGKAPCCDLSTAKDGTYEAESAPYEKAGFALGTSRIRLTIRDHKITDVDFIGITPEGAPKDENYGKVGGVIEEPGLYRKAQVAVRAARSYAAQLLEVQEPAKVDAVTGASVTYAQFQETARAAIAQAKAP